MKYIVTKDGKIIKFDTSDVEEEIAGIKYDILGFRLQTTMQLNCIVKEDIVKIADTIEELCDEFVLINKFDNSHKLASSFKESERDYIIPSCWTTYGAIWTDKGLIYVAKMNEKGELELL